MKNKKFIEVTALNGTKITLSVKYIVSIVEKAYKEMDASKVTVCNDLYPVQESYQEVLKLINLSNHKSKKNKRK